MVSFNVSVITSKWLPCPQRSFSRNQIKFASLSRDILLHCLNLELFSHYYVEFDAVLCPLCVTSALVGSMQTGSQRCSRSNTLASGSKHTVCLYCGQQMAMFNYFHHLSTLSLAQPPPPPLFFFHFYLFFLQVLRNRDFQSGSFSSNRKSLHHLVWFCNIKEIEAIFWYWDVLTYADRWIELCQRELNVHLL